MAIYSDNRPQEEDVSFWLEEKSNNVLRDACCLVDLFRKDSEISPKNSLENARHFLYNLIYDASKVASFAHERDQAWSHEWIDLMVDQGFERFIEFNQRLIGEVSIDELPLKYPISIHKSLGFLDGIERAIQDRDNDKSFVRSQVLENSNELMNIKRYYAPSIANKLKDLIDEQSVYARISWEEFCDRVISVVEDGRDQIIEDGENSIKPWA